MIQAHSSVRVRFAETDAMGVVYHANYLPWCEIARLKLIEGVGFNYKELNDLGYHLPVLEAHINYKFPAKYDDTIEMIATISTRPNVRVKVDYQMFANSKLLIIGHTIHAFVNDKGMPVKPPHDFAKKLADAFDSDTVIK